MNPNDRQPERRFGIEREQLSEEHRRLYATRNRLEEILNKFDVLAPFYRPYGVNKIHLEEQLYRLYKIQIQLQESILNKLDSNGHNLEPSMNLLRLGQFLDSELLGRIGVNGAAATQTAPHSPLAAATNRLHINESPVHYDFPSPQNLNLPRNLYDDDNDPMIQYSPSHDLSSHHWLSNSQSAVDHYYNHHPNYGQHLIGSSHNPQNYNYNGFGSSGSQRREIPSLQLHNSGYDHQYGHYHGHDNIARRHQYQRFSSFTSIDEVRGNVEIAATNHQGSRFLQDKLRLGNPENIDIIFSETKGSLFPLMMHQFGNYVVQKLIDVVDNKKLDDILDILTTDGARLSQLCADDHGSKVVQKLLTGGLRNIGQRYLVASALSKIAVSLTQSTNGNAVISKCLKYFSSDYKKLLLRAIAQNCVQIAQDKSGCCILQKCIDEADEEIFTMLGNAIIQNAETLAQNCFGNYVVQYVIEVKNLEVNRLMAAKFDGKFVSMCTNKHGSNVVEKLVKESGLDEVVDQVISEILNSSSLLQVSQHPFGNYVIQSALKVIRVGDLFNEFMEQIKDDERHLEIHIHGKRVLQARDERIRIQML